MISEISSSPPPSRTKNRNAVFAEATMPRRMIGEVTAIAASDMTSHHALGSEAAVCSQ